MKISDLDVGDHAIIYKNGDKSTLRGLNILAKTDSIIKIKYYFGSSTTHIDQIGIFSFKISDCIDIDENIEIVDEVQFKLVMDQ